MTPPREPNGNSPLSSWLRRLLRYSIANELKPGRGYNIHRNTSGTTLDIQGGQGGSGSVATPFILDSAQEDYITCYTPGTLTTTSGTTTFTPVYIAKPPQIWCSDEHGIFSEDIFGVHHEYSYFAGGDPGGKLVTDSNNIVRLDDTGSGTPEVQIVIPVWLKEEIIYAISAETELDDPNGIPIDLMMVHARHWSWQP